ncbi:Topoisomerase 1-associated factor 1 [Podila humilis]|nr:Topoisomerase 1-associated factor 1 [Podila humilis]
MDADTESLLVSTCHALGGYEDRSENLDDDSQVYVMGDECLECLKDLKRFIKFYDEPGDNIALAFLGNMGILEKDLIPIMMLNTPANSNIKERMVLACIELMVPMTWVLDVKALKEMTITEEDTSIVGNIHARNEILRSYKRAFLQPGVLGAIFTTLLKPLEVEQRMRSARDQAVIRLGLALFRNLVAIPDTESSVTGTMDQFISSIMQEELLNRFQEENIMALLITLASSAGDVGLAEWNTMTLEVFYYIFMGVEPDELIPAISSTVKNSQLQVLLQKEQEAKANQSTAGRKRHDRFGTTGEVRMKDGTRMVLHKKGALFTEFEKQLDDIKKPRAKTKRHTEFGEYKKNITKAGAAMLRNLAMSMLESCFNPLFGSLRRDMEMSRERFKEHHRGQYLYLMGFLLKYQRLYADFLARAYYDQKRKATDRQLLVLKHEYKENMKQCNFGLVGTAVQVKSVFQVIHLMRQKSEEKEWETVRRCMDCFQEILMTLYAMSKSSDETFKEASNNVQNNLYYEGATLELFLDLTRNFKTQSKKYDISSGKSDAPNTDSAANGELPQVDQLNLDDSEATNEIDQDQEQEEDDEEGERDENAYTMHEHRFIFSEYERRFATENVVKTYCTVLEDYQELNETEFHWIASMFHRIAVNCANPAVFYKMSTLQLFHQILQCNKEESKKDLIPLTNYIVHQFFKKLQEYPPLIIEVLFPKSTISCLTINLGVDVAEQKAEASAAKKEKQLENTELEVDSQLPLSQQIRIAVMALVDEDNDDLAQWAHDLLKDAIAQRALVAFQSESALAENPDLMESIGEVEDIKVIPTTPAKTRALRMEPRFRLLLKLTGFKCDDTVQPAAYIIPRDLSTDIISEHADLIKSVLDQGPIEHTEYNFAELLQTKKKKVVSSSASKKSSGENGRKQEPKEVPAYHSTEYVLDSEDEADEEYYQAEMEMRSRHKADLEEAELQHREKEEENARAKSRRAKDLILQRMRERKRAARAAMAGAGTEDEDNAEGGGEETSHAGTSSQQDVITDDDEALTKRARAPKSTDDVDSEDSDKEDLSRSKKPSLHSVVGRVSKSNHEGEDEHSVPLSASQGTTTRKRQIIWDDSDDDVMGDDSGSAVESPSGNGDGDEDLNIREPPLKKFAFEEN